MCIRDSNKVDENMCGKLGSEYTIDPATQTQTVVVNPNVTQTLYFENTPSTTLVIEKYPHTRYL